MGNERQLVEAALGGDPAAFAALVVRRRGLVEAVLARMLSRDEVEEVAQETWLRAYLGLSQLRDPERFGGWLCGLAVNLAKMRLRRRAAQQRLVATGGGVATVDLEEPELLEIVRNAVALLPPGQRDVVLMHYVHDLSCEDIARLLGTSPGAVRVRLHRARAQLRRELAPLAPVPIVPTREEIPMVEMQVEDVLVRVASDDRSQLVDEQRIVLLREEGGERLLPIWVGAPEGNALAYELGGDAPPRPMTADLMVELLRVMGARIEGVAVSALREKVFYATISVAIDGTVEEVDARPSDALNLAVRIGAPIRVGEDVLEQAALGRDGLEEKLAEEAAKAKIEVPPGEWRSLSAELLQSLYTWLGGGEPTR